MPFFVQVITTKRDDPDHIIDTRKINYEKSKAREWLAKHSYWALRHGYAVHTARADELPTLDQVARATKLSDPNIVKDIMSVSTLNAVEQEREKYRQPNDPVEQGADLPFYQPTPGNDYMRLFER